MPDYENSRTSMERHLGTVHAFRAGVKRHRQFCNPNIFRLAWNMLGGEGA
jgi:hypothetical protein